MRRWLGILVLATFALQSTALLTVLAADVCVDSAASTSWAASEEDDCPPVCLRCACCGHIAPTVLRLAFAVSQPVPAVASTSGSVGRLLAPDPGSILHVPLS